MNRMKRLYNDGVVGACFNIINTVIGVGIVTLPETIVKSGFFLGIFFLTFSLCVSAYTCHLMVQLKIELSNEDTKIESYADLCRTTMGNFGFFSITIMTSLLMWGLLIVYAIIFRLLMESVVSDIKGDTFRYGSLLLLGAAVCIMLPLSLFKNISALAWTSGLSAAVVFVIIILIASRANTYHTAMTSMTIEKMLEIEKKLNNDRAAFLCRLYSDSVKTPDPFHNSELVEKPEKNVHKLWESLKNDKLCKSRFLKTEKILENLKSVSQKHDFGFKNENATLVKSLGALHAQTLYYKWSINDEDAKKRNNGFKLFGFARIGAIISIGIFSASFVTQQSVFSIFQSLKKQDLSTWSLISVISFSVIYVACCLLALIGYFTAEYQSRDYVFTTMVPRYLGLKSPDITINIARMLLLLTIALTYPMQLFFNRVNVIILVKSVVQTFQFCDISDKLVFYCVTATLWSSSVVIGVFFNDIFFAFGIVGALFSSPIIFIFPVVSLIIVRGGYKKFFSDKKTVKSNLIERVLPIVVLVFGVTVWVLGPVFTVTQNYGITNF